MIQVINRLLGPLHTRVVNMIARAVVRNIDDTKKAQLLQIEILKDELKDDVERLQPYGFTSVPKAGAEAVVVFPAGKRDHGIVIVVEDRRYRVKQLEEGEVAVYNDTGSKIVLKKNGDIEVLPSSNKLKITADVTVTGKLDVSAKATFADDVDVSKTLTATTDVIGGGKHLKTHVHSVGTGASVDVKTSNAIVGSPCTAASGVAGALASVSGSTAAPT